MEIRILFFAKARELISASSSILKVPSVPLSTSDLYLLIEESYPLLKVLERKFVLALNESYIENEIIELKIGDELAVIPPISGG